jgi:CDP-paratose 2-epimerase
MKILITGICGFAGSTLAFSLRETIEGATVFGLDNLSRPGSHEHLIRLRAAGIDVLHGDVRCSSDLENLPTVNWVIDASANPSVLAGITSGTTSRQVVEHNLLGTVNLLEYCRRSNSGFILLSTSRVYSATDVAALPFKVENHAFWLQVEKVVFKGVGENGIDETFPTMPPISLYGATKLASEIIALEYGASYGFPVWINRCGVLAGAGQFGRFDQGIFAFWIHSWKQRLPLSYIGFGGEGHQVRDCLHPRDLAPVFVQQMAADHSGHRHRIFNLSGGNRSAHSLRALSDWCAARFGNHDVSSQPEGRPNDVPWMILDSTRATQTWSWQPMTPADSIFEEIAAQAEDRPDWLELSGADAYR